MATMQTGPYKTLKEAKTVAEKNQCGFDTAYARPNPNEKEGGYIVVYETKSWWGKPTFGGCPRARR